MTLTLLGYSQEQLTKQLIVSQKNVNIIKISLIYCENLEKILDQIEQELFQQKSVIQQFLILIEKQQPSIYGQRLMEMYLKSFKCVKTLCFENILICINSNNQNEILIDFCQVYESKLIKKLRVYQDLKNIKNLLIHSSNIIRIPQLHFENINLLKLQLNLFKSLVKKQKILYTSLQMRYKIPTIQPQNHDYQIQELRCQKQIYESDIFIKKTKILILKNKRK